MKLPTAPPTVLPRPHSQIKAFHLSSLFTPKAPPVVLHRLWVLAASCVLSFLTGTLAFAAQRDEPLDVIVCAGQSNMAGYRTSARGVSEPWREEALHAQIFRDDTWSPATFAGGSFGPELGFALEFWRSTGRELGIVKVAKGGSSLADDWKQGRKSGLYADLVKLASEATKSREIRIVGIIWVQGERDARSTNDAKAYKSNLKALISALRKDLKAKNAPFVAARVNPPEDPYEAVNKVRKAIETVRASRYGWIDCDDLAKLEDKKLPDLHYTSNAITKLGMRLADEVCFLNGEGLGGKKASKARAEPVVYLRVNLRGIRRHRPHAIATAPGLDAALTDIEEATSKDDLIQKIDAALSLLRTPKDASPGTVASFEDIRAVLGAIRNGKHDLSGLPIHRRDLASEEDGVPQLRGLPGVKYRP